MKNFVMILVVLTGCSSAQFSVPENDGGSEVSDSVKTITTALTVPDTNTADTNVNPDTNPQDSGVVETGNDTTISDSGTDSGAAETAPTITCDATTQITTSIMSNQQNIPNLGNIKLDAKYSICTNAVMFDSITAPCARNIINTICANSQKYEADAGNTDGCYDNLATAIYQITAPTATFSASTSVTFTGTQLVCEMFVFIVQGTNPTASISNCSKNILNDAILTSACFN
jgi:hypothetical protein